MQRFMAIASLALAIVATTAARAQTDQAASLAQATHLRLTGKYAEAEEIYAELVDEHPERSAIGLVRCQLAVGKTEAAQATLDKAIEPHDRSAALLAEAAVLAFGRGDYAAAQRRVEQALAIDADRLAARWIAAELHRVAGRLDEADRAYKWFIDYYNAADTLTDPEQLHWIALAAAQYARWNRNPDQFAFLVNTLYPDALELNADYWPAHVESARLFLEKFNQSDAAAEVDAALRINPNAADAHVVRARVLLRKREYDAATEAVDRALQLNPKSVAALQLKAFIQLDGHRADEALRTLQHAVKLNPVDEETLGQLAATYGVLDRFGAGQGGARMQEVVDQAVQRNEHCGRFFWSLAQSLDTINKFPQAVGHYEEAIRRMPQLVGPRGSLGMMLMRLGDETTARRWLEQSFDIDPFNVRVKNTLEVLDVLAEYETLQTEHFLIRFDPEHDKLLARLAADYLEHDVYPELCAKLGYEPPERSLFEIFSRKRNTSGHGWFSARMVGLPYIGTVGACGGKMVAIVSPNDMPGRFNWAQVLRHEFVHVVTLPQTDFHIPHWYTEALAVLYEGYPRPPQWNRVLTERLQSDTLYDLDTIDFGFARPNNHDDWTLAYCQAELYAEFIVEQFGEEALVKLLDAYKERHATAEAIPACFDIEQDEFERRYREFLEATVAQIALPPQPKLWKLSELEDALAKSPDDADLLAELAYAQLRRGDKPAARKHADAALKLDAKQQLAAYVLARLKLSIGETAAACRELRERLDEDAPHPRLLALAAALCVKAEEHDEAIRLYKIGVAHFGDDDQWLRGLARAYLTTGRDEPLAEVLTRLASLEADDATVRKKLAQLALARDDHAAALRWATEAMYVVVSDAQVHAWRGEALAGLEEFARAVDAYQIAVELDDEKTDWLIELARCHVQLEQFGEAREHLEAVLAQQPDHEAAQKLLESIEPDE